MASLELHDLKFSPAMWNFASKQVTSQAEKATDNFMPNIASNLANFFHQANLSWSAL